MMLAVNEVAKLRTLLNEIDKGMSCKGRRSVINTRTRNIRLMLSKAERREKNRLL